MGFSGEGYKRIEEIHLPDHRLGRHVGHDPRNRDFKVTDLFPGTIDTSIPKVWEREIPAFDQGQLGSCTGNAVAGLLASTPFSTHHRRRKPPTEAEAVKIYSRETHDIDPTQAYPPYDPGGTVQAACQAAKEMRLLTGYHWGFTTQEALDALCSVGPLDVGFNWYNSFDEPDAKGIVRLPGGATIRGGHSWEIIAWHPDTSAGAPGSQLFEAVNSWGPDWGVVGTNKAGGKGRFFIPADVFDRLVKEDGETSTIKP